MKNLLIITQRVNKNDQLLGFFIDWIARFAGKFGKITVLCLEKGEFSLPDNVRVISLGKDRGASKPIQLFNFYKNIFWLKNEYDAVFVHMNPIWTVLGGPSWRLMHKKIYFWYTVKAVTAKLRLAEKFADVIFTASRESFRLPSKKVIITGHGINTDFFAPDPSRKPKVVSQKLRLLSVGRIAPIKNYETLIDAAKTLKSREINFSVTMIGEAPLERDKAYEKGLRNKVRNLKLEDSFNFIGKVNHYELVPYYQSNDIFIHLSKTGSLDKTILEAMACGMKVLSSNDSARAFLPAELVFDQDDPRELADKIQNISQSQQSVDLRDYVIKNHNLDNLINRISKIINENESRTKSRSHFESASPLDLGEATSYGMNKIAIYPFPFSSKNNKYTSLLYSALSRVGGDFSYEIINCNNKFTELFRLSKNSGRFDKNIVHIHWVNAIYGSKFFLKSIFLGVVNFSILIFLKRVKKYKIVWTKHNYYSHDFAFPVLDRIGRGLMLRLADKVIIQQKSGYEKIKDNSKFVYIPHGNYIDAYGPAGDRNSIRSKFNIADDDILLVSFGIVKPYKKLENIIRAVRKSNNSRLKFLIAGQCSAEYSKKLKEVAGDSGNIVFYFSFIEDSEVPDYLAAADFSVFCYDDSVLTSGGIILSLSYGVPVIARNMPASELIKDGKNGFIYTEEGRLVSIFNNLESGRANLEEIINSVKDLGWDFIAKKLAFEFSKI